MAISGVTSAADLTVKTKTATENLQDQKNQFLKLLTTQLKNQDPLSPMDSNQLTSQLVQFNGVEQQLNTNSKLDQLIALQGGTGGSALKDSLGYIGLDVQAKGSAFAYDGTNATNLAYTLPSVSSATSIGIFDDKNNLVRTIKGDTAQGKHALAWDGKDDQGQKLPAGNYSFKVGASDQAGTAVSGIGTYTFGKVTGVENSDTGVILKIGDRSINMTDVISAKYNFNS